MFKWMPSKNDARTLKALEDINLTWKTLFWARRLTGLGDMERASADQVADILTGWAHQWTQDNPGHKGHSRFNVFIKQTYGDRRFVLALLQTGITWAPRTVPGDAAQHAGGKLGWADETLRGPWLLKY